MVSNIKRQLAIAGVIYLGQVIVGFGLGWTASIVPKLQDPDQSPLPDVITEGQASWMGSGLYIGAIIGPYISAYVSNKNGRKPSLMIGAALNICAFIMLSAAKSLAMIIAGRILSGLGAGIISVLNVVYIAEIASTNIRGVLLTAIGIFATLGTLVVYSVGPFVPYYAVSITGLVLTVVYLGLLLTVLETPLFHVKKGNEKKAEETLVKLGREDDYNTLTATKLEIEQRDSSHWLDLIRVKNNRKAFIITLTLNIAQQLSGVVVVIFFVTTIFELAGSSIQPDIATIIIGLLSSCITPLFVERAGRKILLLISTGMCCISLAVLELYFLLDSNNHQIIASIQWLPLVSLMAFFLAYDIGFGIIPGTLVGEMFETNVRSAGSTLTSSISYVFGFCISTAFGYSISYFGGHVVFWFFSFWCGMTFIFTAIFVPETKGKTLAEVQEILRK